MAVALAGALGGGGILSSLIGAVISFAISYIINKAFAPEEEERQDPADQGVKQRIPTDPRNKLPIVYGDKSVAGQITYAAISGNNQKMAFIISLCEGPVSAINSVKWEDKELYFNNGGLSSTALNSVNRADPDDTNTPDDDFLNGGRFKCRTFPNGGRCGPMEDFNSDWRNDSANRQMPNTAYVYVELTYDQEKRVTSLTNRLQFNVSGRTVKPISGTTTATSYAAASEPVVGGTVNSNPADILIDYLTNTRYGAGVPLSAIDFASFNEHKAFCDETLAEYVDLNGVTQTSNKRYTTNGSLNTNQDVDQNVSDLTVGNSGFMTWNYGQFGIVTDKVKSTVFNFSEDNIFGKIQISKLGFDNKLNKLTVRFDSTTSKEQQEQVIQEVPLSNRNANEPVLERTVTLPMTNNSIEAGRVSSIYLDKSRQDLTASFTTSLAASGIESGDVIEIAHATPGWPTQSDVTAGRSGKQFVVQSVEEKVVNNIIGLEILVQEYAETTYDARVDEVDTAPNTGLPNPFKAPDISNLLATEDNLVDEPNLFINWDVAFDSVLVDNTEIGYRHKTLDDQLNGSYRYDKTNGTSLVIDGDATAFPSNGSLLVNVETDGTIVTNPGILIPYTSRTGSTFTIDLTNALAAGDPNVVLFGDNSTVTLPLTFKSLSGGTAYELSPLIASEARIATLLISGVVTMPGGNYVLTLTDGSGNVLTATAVLVTGNTAGTICHTNSW